MVENDIRNLHVSSFVSQIAAVSEVRSKLVEQQQEMGKSKGIIMDGRDIGTVVFPDAELKILRVIKKLRETSPLTIKSTFLWYRLRICYFVFEQIIRFIVQNPVNEKNVSKNDKYFNCFS